MKIHETRRSNIDGVVIDIDSIRMLARFFSTLFDESADKESSSLKFRVDCGDGSYYSSSTLDLFSEGSPVLLKRPESIEMNFDYYPSSLDATLKLRHGHSEWSNQFSVSGDDPNWVNGAHRRGQDVLNALPPQSRAIRVFSVPLFIVFALCCGFIMFYAYAVIRSLIGITPGQPPATPLSFINYVFAFIMIGMFGAIPSMVLLEKLRSLWPAVELQIGPEHHWIEKRRKGWLLVALAVFVVPILQSGLYDFIKTAISK